MRHFSVIIQSQAVPIHEYSLFLTDRNKLCRHEDQKKIRTQKISDIIIYGRYISLRKLYVCVMWINHGTIITRSCVIRAYNRVVDEAGRG